MKWKMDTKGTWTSSNFKTLEPKLPSLQKYSSSFLKLLIAVTKTHPLHKSDCKGWSTPECTAAGHTSGSLRGALWSGWPGLCKEKVKSMNLLTFLKIHRKVIYFLEMVPMPWKDFCFLTHWLTVWYWLGWSGCWKLSIHTAVLALMLWSLNTQYTVTFSPGRATTFSGM